jgi:hypothetical protein
MTSYVVNNNIKIEGIKGAVIVLILFSFTSTLFSYFFNIHSICYYWLTFTILTGIWEYTYVTNRKSISRNAEDLIKTNSHVWFKYYNINMILPWNTSNIFYSEYAAYADREYMSDKDDWSIIIEGSHALFCAIFALLSLYFNFMGNMKNFYITMSISMGTQLMNSILYMGEYLIQLNSENSVNYKNKFPCGKYLEKRPFMYINLFWSLMPSYVLIYYINNK